jgi:hypothetical protein
MAIKEILTAIAARMVVLGFKEATERFDFDAVPDSIINKNFRTETALAGNEYDLGGQANPVDSIAIFIAYKIPAAGSSLTVYQAALDDREAVESDLAKAASIVGLASSPVMTMDREATAVKYLGDYLISKLAFSCDYLRTL